MKNLNSLWLLVAVVFVSCNENRVFEQHVDPPGHLQWERKDEIKIDVEIIDTTIKYDQTIAFRHATGYAFTACTLVVKETSPSGELREEQLIIETANSQGYLGDCSGDICDVEYLWQASRKFSETGNYQYHISHAMSDDLIHMVMEVGMILDKVPREVSQ